MLELKLHAFIKVAETGSFTAAAERLGLSVSAVSKYIVQLEKRLGSRLLLRSTRCVRLTPEGRSFLADVLRASKLIDSACENLHLQSEEPRGLVRVCVPGSFAGDFLMFRLPEVLAKYPDLSVEVSFSDVPLDPIRSAFDIVVQYGKPPDSRLIARRIGRLPTVLAASPQYLARAGVPLHPSELGRHDCIGIRLSSTQYCNWAFEPREPGSGLSSWVHHPISRVFVSGQYDRAIAAAIAGLGIVCADIPTALPLFKGGLLNCVLPEYVLSRDVEGADIFMVFPYQTKLSPRVRVVVDLLSDCMKIPEIDNFDPARWQYKANQKRSVLAVV